MTAVIRQRYDTVNNCVDNSPPSLASQNAAFAAALKDLPHFRCKFVTLQNGQVEASVIPTNTDSLIDARMGFNPLLDRPRKRKLDLSEEERAQKDDENKKRSSKRARQGVRWMAKNLNADHMLTFTYRENVQDRAVLQKNWKEFTRLYMKRYPEWDYVLTIEAQERGSLHLHCGVKGRQDIRYMLFCWLRAIGQDLDQVNDWYIHGVLLGEDSLGAVNVTSPSKRWGTKTSKWSVDKLAAYMTKYISKDFDLVPKGAKRYWHSKGIAKPAIHAYWLVADNWLDAVKEAYQRVFYSGCTNYTMWGDESQGVAWITGSTDRRLVGLATSGYSIDEAFSVPA